MAILVFNRRDNIMRSQAFATAVVALAIASSANAASVPPALQSMPQVEASTICHYEMLLAVQDVAKAKGLVDAERASASEAYLQATNVWSRHMVELNASPALLRKWKAMIVESGQPLSAETRGYCLDAAQQRYRRLPLSVQYEIQETTDTDMRLLPYRKAPGAS